MSAKSANSEKWKDDAACKDVGFSLFYPQIETEDDIISISDFVVKDEVGNPGYYCARCPVIDECLAYSIDNRIVDGIHGGMNEEQRKRLINIDIKDRRATSRELRARRRLEEST